MRALILLALLCVALPAAAAPFETGGDDILVYDGQAIGPLWSRQADSHSNGDIYAVVRDDVPTVGNGLRVLRSTDGGSTWTTWSRPTAPVGTQYLVTRLHIAEGLVDRLYLTYAIRSAGAFDYIAVSKTELGASPPSWTTSFPMGTGTTVARWNPQLVSDHDQFSDYYLYLAASNEFDQIYFTRSTDGGVSWSPEVQVSSGPGRHVGPRLDYGLNGVIHLAWTVRDAAFDEEYIVYRRATGYAGSGLASWDPIVTLSSAGPGLLDTSVRAVAASKVSDRAVILADRGELNGGGFLITGSMLLQTTDAGSTWNPSTGLESVRLRDLQAAPNRDAWAVLESTNAASYQLFTTEDPAGPWDAGRRFNDRTPLHSLALGSLVHLQTEGNRWGMLWADLGTDDVWFDGEWRGDPGYPNLKAGFPVSLTDGAASAPALVDLDGNGSRDIIVALHDGSVLAVDPFGNPLSGWPVNAGFVSDGPVVVTDLNGDDELEVYVGGQTGEVFGFGADGIPLPGFPYDTSELAPVYLSAGALGGPYARTLVVCAGSALEFLNYRGGAPLETFGWTLTTGQFERSAAIGDIDGDGVSEVVFAGESFVAAVELYNPAPDMSRSLSSPISGGIGLADIDFDGDVEICVPTENGTLYMLEGDGTDYGPDWPYVSDSGEALGDVAIADMRSTGGAPDIVTIDAEGSVHGVKADGSPVAGFPLNPGIPASAFAPPIIGNVSGFSDVVAPTESDGIWAWNPAGELVDGWPRIPLTDVLTSAAIGDLDQDTEIEVVWITEDELVVVEVQSIDSGNPAESWPMAGYDPQRTRCSNCSEDVVTAAEPDRAPSRFAFAAPHPNPSHGSTTFRFSLPHADTVALDVYDLRGRRVRSIVERRYEAGEHLVGWNGRDENAQPLASGVYMVRLKAGERSETRRVTLLR